MNRTSSIIASILISVCALLMPACTPSQVESALPTITLAAQGGTALALSLSKVDSKTRNQVYCISTACYSVTSGDIAPTVEQLQTRIAQYVTDDGAAAIGSLVVSLYAEYFPRLNGNAKVADKLLAAIAKGVSKGAATSTPAAAVAVAPYRRMIIAQMAQNKLGHRL